MRTYFLRLSLAAALLFMGVQAQAQSVQTDFDRGFDLGSLKTFNFLPQERSNDDPLKAIAFVEQRIREGLTEALAARGILKSENPDFLIALYAKIEQESQWNVTGYAGWGPAWRYGGGTGSVSEERYAVGTVVVDFVSASKKEAVWHGSATKTIDLEKSEKNIRKGTEKLIGEYAKDVAKQQKGKGKS